MFIVCVFLPSTNTSELEFAFPLIHQGFLQEKMFRLGKSWIALDHGKSFFSCFRQKGEIPNEIGDPKFRQTGLLGSEHLSGSPDGQIFFGDFEPVGCFFHDPKTLLCILRPPVLGD